MELLEYLRQDENFFWMPEEALEVLNGCFDMEMERISAGEQRTTDGRMGYLLLGSGEVKTADGVKRALKGSLFGVRRRQPQGHDAVASVLTAAEDSVLLWLRKEVIDTACYRCCWFHARLLLELNRMVDEMQ